jgi:UDP-N-acetylmuramate--alanine ligase
VRRDRKPLRLTLNIPGTHNVYNALAAITMATDEGVDDAAIERALQKFAGVGRRFEQHASVDIDDGNVLLIDDYGHHPKEVDATIKAARQSFPDRRLVMLFQPHRYSRTRDCYDDFVEVLSSVDELLLLDVYSAGESPIIGADTKSLARSIRLRGEVEPTIIDKDNLAPVMQRLLKANDMLITQGAGNVGHIAIDLAANNLYIK